MPIIKANTNKQAGIYFPLCKSLQSMKVVFTESCKYNSGSEQSDLHKLHGVGMFHLFGSFKSTKNKKWWELHKWLSVRVGWRYNIQEDCFEVTDYTYVNGIGERNTSDNIIFKVKVDTEFTSIAGFVGNKMVLFIVDANNNLIPIVAKDCNVSFFAIFLKLRAYVGSGFTTTWDMIIKKIK